jgi:hypothetical protein
MTKPSDSGCMAEEIKQAVPSPEDRVRAIKEREQKATKGPWLVRRRHASADRCDGIEAHIGHTHPPEQSCWDVDECPGQEAEMIVQTDGGFYGPNADDADFIAHARADIPYLLSLVEELKGQVSAVSASQQPRCPKCSTAKLFFRHIDGSANRTCAFVAVQCPICLPDGTIYLDSPAEMAQFFTVAPTEAEAEKAKRELGVMREALRAVLEIAKARNSQGGGLRLNEEGQRRCSMAESLLTPEPATKAEVSHER